MYVSPSLSLFQSVYVCLSPCGVVSKRIQEYSQRAKPISRLTVIERPAVSDVGNDIIFEIVNQIPLDRSYSSPIPGNLPSISEPSPTPAAAAAAGMRLSTDQEPSEIRQRRGKEIGGDDAGSSAIGRRTCADRRLR